jgi:hypothetical protein
MRSENLYFDIINSIDRIINSRIGLIDISMCHKIEQSKPKAYHVYALFTKHKLLMYIGKCEHSLKERLSVHKSKHKGKVGYMVYFECVTGYECAAIEKALIQRHPETINRFHNPKWLWSNYCWTLRKDFLVAPTR